MEKNNALITEEQRIQNIIDFNEDIFQKVSSQFSQNFYPFIIKDNNLQNLDIENSQEFLSNLEFYRIYECTIESTDNLFEYFVNKMQKIFTMFYSLNKEFYYGFVSKEDKVNLVIGFQSEFFSDEMTKIIAGNISGIKLEKLNENFSSFKNTPNLRELYAVHTYYDDPQTFDGLEVCKKLKYIEMLSCPFKNFLPFSKLKSLEHLDVSYGSEIESLEGLEQLPNLKRLCLYDNDFIKKIDDISLIKNLKILEIEKHKVLKIIDEIRKRDIALWIIPDES